MKTTPIPVKFDRQGHSCNFYAGLGPTSTSKRERSWAVALNCLGRTSAANAANTAKAKRVRPMEILSPSSLIVYVWACKPPWRNKQLPQAVKRSPCSEQVAELVGCKHSRTDKTKKAALHLLVTPELTAHHSGLFSHHCRQCPVLLALLPA